MNKQTNEWISFGKVLIIVVASVMTIRLFLVTPVVVDGASMLPTFEDGDRVIVSKQSAINRFDVVVFEANENQNYIKRVIGLPGDRIAYKGDKLYVNDVLYDEPYLVPFKQSIPLDTYLTEDFTLEQSTGYSIIPEGYIFVLGDNRTKSKDSRDPKVGLVPKDAVLGEVELVFYPFANLGLVK